jgi:hypothetical protein
MGIFVFRIHLIPPRSNIHTSLYTYFIEWIEPIFGRWLSMAFFPDIRHNKVNKSNPQSRKEDVYVDCQESFGIDIAVDSGLQIYFRLEKRRGTTPLAERLNTHLHPYIK